MTKSWRPEGWVLYEPLDNLIRILRNKMSIKLKGGNNKIAIDLAQGQIGLPALAKEAYLKYLGDNGWLDSNGGELSPLEYARKYIKNLRGQGK